MAISRIGYLNIIKAEKAGYLGGLLIVNRIGVPVEFQHTEPINPTEIQEALYGKAMEAYLKTEVMSKSLLAAAKEKPDAMICADEGFLPLSASLKFPVMHLAHSKQQPLSKPGEFSEVAGDECFVQTAGSREPLTLKIDRRNAPAMNAIRAMVVEIGQSMDAVEPLDRVGLALEKIARER